MNFNNISNDISNDIVFNVLSKPLNELFVLNLRGEKMYLDHSLNDIICFLGITNISSDYIKENDEELIKRQLCLEGSFLTNSSDLDCLLDILFKTPFRAKFKLMLKDKRLEFYKPLLDMGDVPFRIILATLLSCYRTYLDTGILVTDSTLGGDINNHLNYLVFAFVRSKKGGLTYEQFISEFKLQPFLIGLNVLNLLTCFVHCGLFRQDTLDIEFILDVDVIKDVDNTNKLGSYCREVSFTQQFIDCVNISVTHSPYSIVNVPMITPPIKWVNGSNTLGGYLRCDLYNNRLIHYSFRHNHQTHITDIGYNFINSVSLTPFIINAPLLKFISDNYDILKVKGTINDSHNHLLKLAYIFNSLNVVFYLPCYFDWRTRCYTSNTFLSYQSNVLSRNLICFSRGIPLNKEGIYRLVLSAFDEFKNKRLSISTKMKWYDTNQLLVRFSKIL